MATRTGTQSIDRASQLLVHVVEEDDAPTVGELAQLAGLPKSTTSRLVGALERQGLVQRDPGRGAISPGPVLLRYARRETSAPDLVELAADALDRLAARQRRDGEPRRRDADRGRDARPARQPPHPRLDQLGRPAGAAPRLRGRQGLPRRGRRCRCPKGRSSGSARGRSPIRRSCAATSSAPAPAATRRPSTSSRPASGRSPLRCATRAAPSSRHSASPAPPSACTTACSTSSAGSSATRPPPCSTRIGYDDAKRGAA